MSQIIRCIFFLILILCVIFENKSVNCSIIQSIKKKNDSDFYDYDYDPGHSDNSLIANEKKIQMVFNTMDTNGKILF